MRGLKNYWLIILILILGVLIRVIITANGNFIFHMDNARDMVDIREMVVLQKPRLIGPTSGIEGVFTGPLWYYISAVPYVLSGGDPYGSILLQVFFWAVGTYFLLQITKRWGIWAMGAIGGIWVASNLVILNSQHSLSPNPILFLMPMFIYLLEKYLTGGKQWQNIFCWLLIGLFFQLEMAWGIFMPLVMIVATISERRNNFFKDLGLGFAIFGLSLLPQILFDIRHQFLMSNSLLAYLFHSLGKGEGLDIGRKILGVLNLYWAIYRGLFMNWMPLVWGSFFVLSISLLLSSKQKDWMKEKAVFVSFLVILIPLLGYLISPIKVMPWHAQAGVGAYLILIGYGLGKLGKLGRLGQLGVIGGSLVIIIYSIYNLQVSYLRNLRDLGRNTSPSLFRNEISAVDYVYRQAQGKDFKAYVYMPSVIDYPYQYLFWWYGKNKYGYVPADYAYLPNMPKYISGKEAFSNSKTLESSGKIFLIKEPDTRDERHLWENSFKKFPIMFSAKIGSIEVEERLIQPE